MAADEPETIDGASGAQLRRLARECMGPVEPPELRAAAIDLLDAFIEHAELESSEEAVAWMRDIANAFAKGAGLPGIRAKRN